MSFALDASTRVVFHGERYLHAYLDHQRRVLASAHRAIDALEAGGAKRRRTTVDD